MAEHGGCEPEEAWEGVHQRWEARQRRHPQYEIDEYSGEETVREGDGLEMMVERWRRRMEKTGSVVNEKEEDAVTSAAEAVDEEPGESRRHLRRTMSSSVSDGVEEDTGVPLKEECRWSRFFSRQSDSG